MLRSRLRRSFTVEIKSKTRQTAAWPHVPADEGPEQSAPSAVNWAALDPAPERPERYEAPAPAEPAAKPRRILPSLIAAEAEPEPEPVAARERPLPRVRRIKPAPAQAGASPAPSWSMADLYEPAPAPAAPRQAAAPAAVPARRKPPVLRAGKPGLRPGERWKRRLPRVCW